MSLDLSSSFLHFKIPMPEVRENGIYAFDQFKLDTEILMLYRDGAEISLPPKVVRTLSVLIENRGTILSKEELIDRVWVDSVVEESNLSQHLYLLRKTLGNKPDGQPYIETLRRRGYRFTGDVQILTKTVEKVQEESAAPVPPAPALAVEREGNVLRLVDWNSAPDGIVRSPVLAEETAVSPRTSIRPVVALGAVVFLTAVTMIIVVWYGTRSTAVTNTQSELTVSRLTNGTFPIDASISHDGDYFVYHEIEGEVSRLWLQQVAQSGRIEIGNTAERTHAAKTFSPDGRFIYYGATEKGNNESSLYRVPTMGGPHTKLLTGIYGPVSFSPDGNEIVFLRFDKDMMRSFVIVADKDGRRERILFETAHPRRIVGPPTWSPNGNLIAYAEADLSNSTLVGTVSLRLMTLSDGSLHPLTAEKWDTVYRIAWTSDGTGLLAIATRAGEGRSPLRDQVYYLSYPDGGSRRLTNEGNRHYLWSLGVTKHDAVIANPFSRSSQIWSVDMSDAATTVQISTGSADGGAGLAPLPDGRISYIARTGDALNVWIMNADGSAARQLTSDPAVVEEVRADPRGRYLVFVAESEAQTHLFRINVDGSDLRQLTFGNGHDGDSTISPDGNWIVYGSLSLNDAPTNVGLWKISIDGGEPIRFTDENCASPNFSPDGRWVSCIREDKEILVLSAIDGKIVESYQLPAHSTVNFGAGWLPDSSGLTFIRGDKGVSNVWVQPRNREAARKLTNFTNGFLTRFAFSSDGSRLYVARGYPVAGAILISNFR